MIGNGYEGRTIPTRVASNVGEDDVFKPGDTTNDGYRIASIIAQDPDLVVYVTDTGQIRYFTISNAFAAKVDVGTIGDTVSSLKRLLDSCNDEQLRSKLNDRIASALYDALLSESTKVALDRFAAITATLRRVVDPHTAKLRTITTLFCVTFVVAVALMLMEFYWFNENQSLQNFALSGACGAVGALFSVLTRNSEIAVEPLYSYWNVFLECFAKTVAGVIAALLVVLAVKANVVLGIASNSLFSLLFLSVLAGFSERMVPDLLASTAKKVGVQPAERNRAGVRIKS